MPLNYYLFFEFVGYNYQHLLLCIRLTVRFFRLVLNFEHAYLQSNYCLYNTYKTVIQTSLHTLDLEEEVFRYIHIPNSLCCTYRCDS